MKAGTGTTTYDNLSRGRKQEIDLKRRKDVKDAKDMPKSRMGDAVMDASGALGSLVGGPRGSARADYKAGRDEKIKRAEDKAEYKDLKRKPTKLFRDKNVKGMSDDEMSKMREFKVEENKKGGSVKGMKHGGSVRGDGIAIKGKTKGTMR
jgi:hypothetical protein